MALLHVDFFSEVLGMGAKMDVILPDSYRVGAHDRPKGPFQTLYLLHGMCDDQTSWQRFLPIERYAWNYNLAVVMPCTHMGWYINMDKGLDYWTFVSEELPYVCRRFFPYMSEKREDNFALGMSMGGYGAMKCGLCAPEMFSCAASMSGALDMAGMLTNHARTPEVPSADYWEDVFGPMEKMYGSKNDLFECASRLASSGGEKPKLFMCCGTEDGMLKYNHNIRDHLLGLDYDLTYEESTGKHQWQYWDRQFQRILEWLPLQKREG